MATPIKRTVNITFSNVNTCVACNESHRQKYFIVKKDKTKGPAFDIVAYYYNTPPSLDGNVAMFLCCPCFKLLNRVQDMDQRRQQLTEKIAASSQPYTCVPISKRVIQAGTPEAATKRPDFKPTPKSFVKKGHGMKKLPACRVKMDFYDSPSTLETRSQPSSSMMETRSQPSSSMMETCSQPSSSTMETCSQPSSSMMETHSQPSSSMMETCSQPSSSKMETRSQPSSSTMETCSQPSSSMMETRSQPSSSTMEPRSQPYCKLPKAIPARAQIYMFMNLRMKDRISGALHCLASGSIRKGIRLLLTNKDKDIQGKAITGVKDALKSELSAMWSKEGPTFKRASINEMNRLNMMELSECLEKAAPLTWNALNVMGKGSREVDCNKVITAACILLNSRNMQCNRLQHTVAVAMYSNQLQREGFAILQKLGICVSHSSLQKTLNEAKSVSDDLMKAMKEGMENNAKCNPQPAAPNVVNDHAYSMHSTHMVDHDYQMSTSVLQPTIALSPGFRFNMDNLDFYIRVRDMTQEHQNQSKHYIQMLAVQDRVNCEGLPDDEPIGDLSQIENHELLPTAMDNSALRDDFIHIISLILVQHIPAFKVFDGVYANEFVHQYSDVMKEKSVVVPLGILNKNENKMNDMIQILEYLHNFVPNARNAEEVQHLTEREERGTMRNIPLGGDQLTCERVRGAHMVRCDADSPEERLEGCMSMVEDFHEKMNFLQMLMDRFYKSASAREPGTLHQLKCVINRRNVNTTVSKDYHADSAFIDLVGEGHILSLAMAHFGMEDLHSPCTVLPPGIHLANVEHKKKVLKSLVGEMVDNHLMNKLVQSLDHVENEEEIHGDDNGDGVYNYATNFVKIWLLRKVSIVATRSGDGMRIIRHWKYAMLLYHEAHKVKYRLEAFLLLASTSALYTPRQQHQVIWNRFINLSGGSGKNLDGDYVIELMNKYAKSRVKLIGPNHSPETVMRIGKTMMFCHDVTRHLECEIGADPMSRQHIAQDTTGDLTKIVLELRKANVFNRIPGRAHGTFLNEPSDIFCKINVADFHKWMNAKKKEYAGNKLAF